MDGFPSWASWIITAAVGVSPGLATLSARLIAGCSIAFYGRASPMVSERALVLRRQRKIHPRVLAGLGPAIHGPPAGASVAAVDAGTRQHKAGHGRLGFLWVYHLFEPERWRFLALACRATRQPQAAAPISKCRTPLQP